MSAACAADVLVAASKVDERLLECLADCRATFVRTFEEAQRALREHWFSLVVIDLNFDDVRMFDLLHHVRSLANFKGVPVLCVQGAEAGAGIGAALDRLVKRLGGKGFVDLRATGAAPFRSLCQVAGRARAPRLCILTIDHDVDGAHRLADALERAGHEVDFAYDARTGLDAARRLRPDVILLDVALPRFEELALRLRSEPRLTGALIVGLASTAIDEEDRKRIRRAGIDHVVERDETDAVLKLLADLQPQPAGYMFG